MSVLEAFLLGIVQGLTEFLPVSSSGHLVLVPALLGWELPPAEFDVMLHAASTLALLAYFRREVIEVVMGLFRPGHGRRLLGLLVIGTIPAALIGFFFESQLQAFFERPRAVAWFLVATGIILIAAETLARRIQSRDDVVPGPGGAFGIGAAQAFAILPGISRSGATIASGMALGLDRAAAARFSFLLAIPILIGASIVEIPELGEADIAGGALVAGATASLVSSYAAIAGLISYLQRRGLYPFAAYCIVAGITASFLL